MKYIEHPGLARLSILLKNLDVGDRIFNGRLDLFNTDPITLSNSERDLSRYIQEEASRRERQAKRPSGRQNNFSNNNNSSNLHKIDPSLNHCNNSNNNCNSIINSNSSKNISSSSSNNEFKEIGSADIQSLLSPPLILDDRSSCSNCGCEKPRSSGLSRNGNDYHLGDRVEAVSDKDVCININNNNSNDDISSGNEKGDDNIQTSSRKMTSEDLSNSCVLRTSNLHYSDNHKCCPHNIKDADDSDLVSNVVVSCDKDQCLKRRSSLSSLLSNQQVYKRRMSSSNSCSTAAKSKSQSKGDISPNIHIESQQKLLVDLLTTMNMCFPDYDFSSLTPEMFVKCEDFVSVYGNINYHLSFIVERMLPGFLQDLWAAIKDAICIRDVEIYTYKSTGMVESDPYMDAGCLFSFDYFFVDKKQKKLLFFSCLTKSKVLSQDSLSRSSLDDFDRDAGDSILSSTSSISDLSDTILNDNNDDENDDEDDSMSRGDGMEVEDVEDDDGLLDGEIRYY